MDKRFLAAALAVAGVLAAGAAEARETDLKIFKGRNFTGPADTIKGEVNNLENGFGREVSSMIVRGGAWQVCTGDHFSGRCRVVAEGEYPTLGWLNDKIVSVKVLGDNPDIARYDNWDKRSDWAKRDSREATRDWRQNGTLESNRYDDRDSRYRYDDRDARHYDDRSRDDRYWSGLPR